MLIAMHQRRKKKVIMAKVRMNWGLSIKHNLIFRAFQQSTHTLVLEKTPLGSRLTEPQSTEVPKSSQMVCHGH